jgi:hypothetical protein
MAGPPDITTLVREQASAWSSVTPPNAVAEKLAGAFAETIAGLSALRGGLAFEQEPASFLAALQETKEIAP